ncbi:MAG TPA: hypothetical protein VMK84_11220 [Streptosporangiaceae bacterium]|nr:hypothetical protein [Streptosporangiaceae bacterium]
MSTPATPEPPAEPERRSIKEVVDQLLARYELEREQELDHGDGPGGQAYFVLEVRGIPQGVSGPYGQAGPEPEPEPEAEP